MHPWRVTARRVAAASAVATVAAVAGAAPAAAESIERADTVLAVPADGRVVTTPFVTSAGALYWIEVSGAFAYDRHGGLADCAFHDTNQGVVGQSWERGGIGLLVDGAPAPCDYYNGSHTYGFYVGGTGGRLRFAIADVTGTADNGGALEVGVVTMVAAEGGCHHAFVPVPDSSSGDLVVTAEGRQTGAASALNRVSTEVECRVSVGGTLVAIASSWTPTPVATGSVFVPSVELGRVQRCLTVRAWTTFGVIERVYPCAG